MKKSTRKSKFIQPAGGVREEGEGPSQKEINDFAQAEAEKLLAEEALNEQKER